MDLYFSPASSSAWSDTGNWFEDTDGLVPHNDLPTTGDTVWQNGNGIVIDMQLPAGITLQANASLNLSGGIDPIFDSLYMNLSGYFDLSAALSAVVFQNGCQILVDGGGTLTQPLPNYSLSVLTGSTLEIGSSGNLQLNDGPFLLDNLSTMKCSGACQIGTTPGSYSFNQDGVFQILGGNTNCYLNLISTHQVEILGGNLSLPGGSAASLAAGLVISSGAQLTADGQVDVQNSPITNDGNLYVGSSANLNLYSSVTLTNNGTVYVTGGVNVGNSAGFINAATAILVLYPGTANFFIHAAASVSISGTLRIVTTFSGANPGLMDGMKLEVLSPYMSSLPDFAEVKIFDQVLPTGGTSTPSPLSY